MFMSCAFCGGRPDLVPLAGWITIRIGLRGVVVVGADPRREGATVALCEDRKVLILVCLRAVTSSRGRGAGGRAESVCPDCAPSGREVALGDLFRDGQARDLG